MSEELKFEKALEKLEKIVDDLESGSLDLEEALKKYEEGVKLSALCQKRLSQAEKKIEVLTRSLDGTLKKEAFEPESDSSESSDLNPAFQPGRRKGGKTRTMEAAGDEGEKDLLL